jgi:hypothetical protein
MEKILQVIRSKTMVFSGLLAVLSLLQGNLQLFDLNAEGQMYAGLVVSVTVAVLRVLTTTALSKK